MEQLHSIPGAQTFLQERHIPEPIDVERLASCAPGTLGKGYYDFVVENELLDKFAVNYRVFNDKLQQSGKLDRLPTDMSFMMVRGTQIHDFQHVLTGFDSSPYGELSLAAFYLAQLRFPYHAMRMAVTFGHAAFVNPDITVDAMDAIVKGWSLGRRSDNLNFAHWEAELDTPISDLRKRYSIHTAWPYVWMLPQEAGAKESGRVCIWGWLGASEQHESFLSMSNQGRNAPIYRCRPRHETPRS